MPTLHNLAQVTVQQIYQYLDLTSLLFFARCSKRMRSDANSKISFKYLTRWNNVLNIRKANTVPLLILNHPFLCFRGSVGGFNDALHGLQKFITLLVVSGINNTNIDTIITFLKNNNTLTSLYVTVNNICAIALVDVMKVNLILKSLNFQYSIDSNADGSEISELLKVNYTLTSLDLQGNKINGTCVPEALKMNRTLTLLNLNNNQIDIIGAVALAEAIKVNCILTSLYLSNNQIDKVGIIAIADALKTNETLIILDISSNIIEDDGCVAIAEALKINRSLTSLSVRGNSSSFTSYAWIGDEGAVAIAKAIKINNTLLSLDISSNVIESLGGISIAEAIAVNCTLTSLSMEVNNIGEIGGIAMAKCIKNNRTLTMLDLSCNNFGDEIQNSIGITIAANKLLF